MCRGDGRVCAVAVSVTWWCWWSMCRGGAGDVCALAVAESVPWLWWCLCVAWLWCGGGGDCTMAVVVWSRCCAVAVVMWWCRLCHGCGGRAGGVCAVVVLVGYMPGWCW